MAACVMQEDFNDRISTGSQNPRGSPSKIMVHIMSGKSLKNSDFLGKSDPYCACAVGSGRLVHDHFTTKVISDTLEPGWNETYTFTKFKVGDSFHFTVRDKDIRRQSANGKRNQDEVLGHCSLAWDQFFPRGFNGSLELSDEVDEFTYGLCESLAQFCEGDAPTKVDSKLMAQLKIHEQKLQDKADKSANGKIFRKGLTSRTNGDSWMKWNMTHTEKDTTLDIVMAGIITLNAIVIGFAMDHESSFFDVMDLGFTISFLTEMVMKIQIHWHKKYGPLGYFKSWWRCFDFSIILVDVAQLILSGIMKASTTADTPPAALFRMLRLARIMRVLRLIHLDFLEDLVAMVSGIMGGMSTLVTSLVLFLVVVYVTSLVFRELFGRKQHVMYCAECGDVDITQYFDSVPRSMLTTFRFFFGDFSTVQGVNIYEGIQDAYGTSAQILVCCVFFIVTVGVFNVISAIFVERTLSAAQQLEHTHMAARLNDPELWRTRLEILIRKLFEHHGMAKALEGKPLSASVEALAHEPVIEEEFEEFLEDASVLKALLELEIDAADHKYLFDILDADNTGSITLIEFIDGLKRLRGTPRRSDIITIDLMAREIQEQIHQITNGMNTLLENNAQ